MKKWKHRLNLSDIFHSDELTFEEIRDTVVARLKRSSFFREVTANDYGFDDLVDELGDAETVGQFDFIWNIVYDYADEYDCWITTR